MFSVLYISLLQTIVIVTYKIPFIPKIYKLHTLPRNEISNESNKNITEASIQKFIAEIKKKETKEDLDLDVWDDGEVEW